MTYYVNHHRTQYDGNPATTVSGCTWTSGANGADAATGGRVNKTPEEIHALVKKSEETSPATPGWSLKDLHLAMSRLGVPFGVSGSGWAGVNGALNSSRYVVLQGDSDQFGNGTCSGAFNGDHCIGVYPDARGTQRWIDDPICKTGRWEEMATLERYAAKLDPAIQFGVFTDPVPTITTGVDMRGFQFAPGPCGNVTVKGPGHSALRMADGVLLPMPAGTAQGHAHPAVLDEPINAGFGNGLDRRAGYLYGAVPYGPHFLLATDVTFVPDAGDCSAEKARADAAEALSANYHDRLTKINGLSAV